MGRGKFRRSHVQAKEIIMEAIRKPTKQECVLHIVHFTCVYCGYDVYYRVHQLRNFI